jgi:YVTN family beta-propeller protein
MNGRRRSTTACAFLLACAVAVVLAASPSASARDDVLPRGGKVVAIIHIPHGYGGFAVGEGSVWAVSDDASTLARIDPKDNSITARIAVKPVNPCPAYVCGEPAAGAGAVWLPRASDNAVLRIDLVTNAVVAKIPVGAGPMAAVVSRGAVWVANGGGRRNGHAEGPSVSRIDPASNVVVATVKLASARLASDRAHITAAPNAVWVTVPGRGAVIRIDPRTNAVTAAVRLSMRPCAQLAADARSVWASTSQCGSAVARVDVRTKRQTQTVKGETTPIGLVLGFGSLWVADIDAKVIDRIDPKTGRIVARLPVGGIPIRLGVGFGSVWLRDDTGRVLRIRPHG